MPSCVPDFLAAFVEPSLQLVTEDCIESQMFFTVGAQTPNVVESAHCEGMLIGQLLSQELSSHHSVSVKACTDGASHLTSWNLLYTVVKPTDGSMVRSTVNTRLLGSCA